MRVGILGPVHISSLLRRIPGWTSDTSTLPPGMGGHCLTSLIVERTRRGLATDVITLDTRATDPIGRWTSPLVRLWVVRRRKRHALRDGFAEETRLLHAALKEAAPDVCHAHWTYEYGWAALRQKGRPAIVTIHDHSLRILLLEGWRYLPLFLMTLLVLAGCRNLVAVSPHVASFARRISGHLPPVIPNVLPPGLLSSRRQDAMPERLTITSLVNLSRGKNVRNGLRAFRQVLHDEPTAAWNLIGPGAEKDGPYHQWACMHSLDRGVNFAGALEHDDVMAALALSHVLFHPSLEEAMPGTIAEAMAQSVPVVAARQASGCRWLLDDGRYGQLVSGRCPASMAAAILEGWRNPVSAATMAQAARDHIAHVTNPDVILQKYEDVYRMAKSYGIGRSRT